VLVAFYFRGSVDRLARSVWGMVGYTQGPWLVYGVGGVCEREAGGAGFTRKASGCKL
jgi:hypothetical protein